MNKGRRIPQARKIVLSLVAVLIVLILISGPGCGNQWMLFYGNQIIGQVIDAETGKPIEGVIVVGMWRLSQFLSQGFGGYAKIIEVSNDKEGKFIIPFWVVFKPWNFNSAMHDLAPEIVIYKPGYKLYFSHKIERQGFPNDISKTQEQKKWIKEEYSINPVKLKKIYTDDERAKNLEMIENEGKLFDLIENLDKKEALFLIKAVKDEYLLLPQDRKERFNYIEQIEEYLP